MFGYIKPFKPELKVREFDTYQAFYCGLCRQLCKFDAIETVKAGE